MLVAAAACGCARRQAGDRAVRPSPKSLVAFAESFDQLDPAVWREVEVKGKTVYQIVEMDGGRVLKSESHGQASILLHSCRFHPAEYPWLSWRWRVDQFVEGENFKIKNGSDAPLRVYVYFDTGSLPWQKRNVDYVWSSVLPVDTLLTSPFSGLSKLLVVESGRSAQGKWRSMTRNVAEDYRRCFGQDPPDIVAIGLMTDTDSTGHDAIAYIDDVRLHRDPSP